MNIAFFGVSANPPHLGHLDAILQFVDDFDAVWVSPTYVHAFNKPDVLPYNHRVNLSRLLFNHPKVEVRELDKMYYDATGITPVYTADLMEYYKEYSLTLILGADNRETIYKFKDYQRIINHVVYAKESVPVHSTQIRAMLYDRDARAINYIGPECYQYILDNNLFRKT